MDDVLVRGWTPIYPHLRYERPERAIAWLTTVFGLRELVRLATPDGGFITAKLAGPAGGLFIVAASTPGFVHWMRERVPDLREPAERPWPNLSHTITAIVPEVDAHHRHALAAGATMLTSPASQPWGLRTYAALDLEGNQWEFAQILRIVEPEEWGAIRVGPDPVRT